MENSMGKCTVIRKAYMYGKALMRSILALVPTRTKILKLENRASEKRRLSEI